MGDGLFSVRSMVEADVDAVAEIEAMASPSGWTRSLFAGEFNVDPAARRWLVAERADRGVVGFAGAMIVADEAHVLNVAVDPAWQRRGIARSLVHRLVVNEADAGVAAVTLEVRLSNSAARQLYGQMGFVEAGTRPRYYEDGEDATIMWLRDVHKSLRRGQFGTGRVGASKTVSVPAPREAL